MPSDHKFTDFDIDFGKNSFTGDLSLKTDRNAIRQSIMNIVLTTPGEKPFDPSFGVGVYDLLFENPDNTELAVLERDIMAAVELREPRATVEQVVFDQDRIDSNEITFEIKYLVRQGVEAEPILESLRIEIAKVR